MLRKPSALALTGMASALVFSGCGTKSADAPPTDAGAIHEAAVDALPACTTDLMRDPKNCGSCGHDCVGGTCSLGACDPVVLAGDLDLPSAMVLDGSYVYFAYSGHVARIPAAGGPVEDLSTAAFTAQRLAVDAANVYVMTGSQVLSFPKAGDGDGGAVQHLAAAVGKSLAIDDTRIFFQVPAGLASAPKSGTGDGGVGDGGAGILLAALGSDTIEGIAVDSLNAFFTLPGQGTLLRAATNGAGDGGTPLASGEAFPSELVGDATYVYFTDNMGGTVRRVPKAGGTATDFVVGLGQPRGLAIDAQRLYYTDEMKGAVGSCPLAGCAGGMQTHATGMSPVAVAADPAAVYFLDYRGRALLRVAR